MLEGPCEGLICRMAWRGFYPFCGQRFHLLFWQDQFVEKCMAFLDTLAWYLVVTCPLWWQIFLIENLELRESDRNRNIVGLIEGLNGVAKYKGFFQGGLKTKTQRPLTPLRPPKTPKLENKDPPYFSELRNYDQTVANATESWALATRTLRLLLASWADIIWAIFSF